MIRQAGQLLEWGRAEPVSLLWIIPPALALAAALGLLAWWEYRHSKPGRVWTAVVLRTLAAASLVLWFLEPRWRALGEREYPSQVAIVVDSSASMLLPAGLPEDISAPNPGESPGGTLTRWESAVTFLQNSQLLEVLSQDHQLDVFTFDESAPQLVSSLPRLATATVDTMSTQSAANSATSGKAVSHQHELSLPSNNPANGGPQGQEGQPSGTQTRSASVPGTNVGEVLRQLLPRGRETRLGEALASVVNRYPREVLAGIIVISDGGQNAGADVTSVIDLLRARKVPVFTIGLGPTSSPGDVRIAQVDVPVQPRPRDPFPILVSLEADGYQGKVPIRLEIEPKMQAAPTGTIERPGDNAGVDTREFGEQDDKSRSADFQNTAVENERAAEVRAGASSTIRQETYVEFARDQGAAAARFEVALPSVGQYRVRISIDPQPADVIAQNNRREESFEVVERPLRVLLLAGGPSREFQFLRGVLFRDPAVRVDVFLQSASPGAWQEADEMLDCLPTDDAAWAEYDCLVAIDPDWRKIGPSPADVPKILAILERWVGEQGGGLIFAAGPVYAGDSVAGWQADPRIQPVLRLLPVSFAGFGGRGSARMLTSAEPCPLQFTPEGTTASFLWLEAGAQASQKAWQAFPGVYSCLDIGQLKRGATPLAYLVRSGASRMSDWPVYLAEHFYGAGRVFYIGSSELWRLRAIDERYYERLWLQLIRHVSENRVAGKSRRVFLASDRSVYATGETAFLRARVVDKRFQPLKRDSLRVALIGPEGFWQELRLTPVVGEPGHYRGSFLCQQPGQYRAILRELEETGEEAECRLRVELADVEERTLVRNERLLRYLAEATSGRYYASTAEAAELLSADALPRLIPPRSWVETIVGPPVEPTLGELFVHILGGLLGERASHLTEAKKLLAFGVDSFLFWLAVGLLAAEWLLRQLGRGSVL